MKANSQKDNILNFGNDYYATLIGMVTYEEQLNDSKWKRKRYKILKRDGYKCQCCNTKKSEGVTLHVHHTFYLFGHYAWEYDDSALITFCEQCHTEFHNNNEVPVYIERHGKLINMNFTPCIRCGGVGYFPEFKKRENGICFRCRGARYEELIELNYFDVEHHMESIVVKPAKNENQQNEIIKKRERARKSTRVSDDALKIQTDSKIIEQLIEQSLDITTHKIVDIPLHLGTIDSANNDRIKAIDEMREVDKFWENQRQLFVKSIKESKEIQKKQEEADNRFLIGLAVFIGFVSLMILILSAVNS